MPKPRKHTPPKASRKPVPRVEAALRPGDTAGESFRCMLRELATRQLEYDAIHVRESARHIAETVESVRHAEEAVAESQCLLRRAQAVLRRKTPR